MTNHAVTLYSTTTCHFCVLAKKYFADKNISIQSKDVGVDTVARAEMVGKSGQMGVPVVEIDGQIIVGFQPDVFDQLLRA
jgi:glutaredoxin-like YruB-family protein